MSTYDEQLVNYLNLRLKVLYSYDEELVSYLNLRLIVLYLFLFTKNMFKSKYIYTVASSYDTRASAGIVAIPPLRTFDPNILNL